MENTKTTAWIQWLLWEGAATAEEKKKAYEVLLPEQEADGHRHHPLPDFQSLECPLVAQPVRDAGKGEKWFAGEKRFGFAGLWQRRSVGLSVTEL